MIPDCTQYHHCDRILENFMIHHPRYETSSVIYVAGFVSVVEDRSYVLKVNKTVT